MDAKTIIDQTEQYYLPVFGRYQLALTLATAASFMMPKAMNIWTFWQVSRSIL